MSCLPHPRPPPSTGLRLSEACHLAPSDVDLYEGVLTVREGKFRKSRLVPLHPTATQALTSYAAHRNGPRDSRSGAFFRTDRTPELTPAAVEKTFSRLRHRLGWTAQGRARRPRVHDLRHTFAVRCLLRWYEEGSDVDHNPRGAGGVGGCSISRLDSLYAFPRFELHCTGKGGSSRSGFLQARPFDCLYHNCGVGRRRYVDLFGCIKIRRYSGKLLTERV